MSNFFQKFVGLFPVSKTLRFALKPIGETERRIKEKGLLSEDEERAEKYKQAKKIIDEYHKGFIERALSPFKFSEADLAGFRDAYEALKRAGSGASAEVQESFAKKQGALREQVAERFKADGLSGLFEKKFIKETLPKWLEKRSQPIEGIDDASAIIGDFGKWTTYFYGFNDNRKNIYTAEDHSTAIGYRLVHDNLPKFLDNLARYRYEKADDLGVDFSAVGKELGLKLAEWLILAGFNRCVTQSGIEKYNLIIGGRSRQGNEKQQGLNEKINLHAQQLEKRLAKAVDEEKAELKSQIRAVRSCRMEVLYKQILSDRNTASFRDEPIKNDAELCELVARGIGDVDAIRDEVKRSMRGLRDANPRHIYIKNDRAMADISTRLFGDWRVVTNCLEHHAAAVKFPTPQGRKETKKLVGQRDKWLRQPYFSFAEIHAAMQSYFAQFSEADLAHGDVKQDSGSKSAAAQKAVAASEPLFQYFESLTTDKKNDETGLPEKQPLFDEIEQSRREVRPILEESKGAREEKLKGQKHKVAKIKRYLDALMGLQRFLKPLHVQLKKKDERHSDAYAKDGGFYSGFDALYGEGIAPVVTLYNQTRNYLAKKPYSVEKFKLNFDNQTLAAGWDKNMETANTCVILVKGERFFLGVMDKRHNTIFSGDLPGDGACYKKMVYKQQSKAGETVPNLMLVDGKTVLKKGRRETQGPDAGKNLRLEALKNEHLPENINNIRRNKSYLKSSENFNKDDLSVYIDYYKDRLDYFDFDFQLKESDEYDSFKEFTDHLSAQAYRIAFVDVSATYIHERVNEGKLYLFEIYSKDFSPKKKAKSRPNLQTLYWKALFAEENLKNVVYKLDGGAELFHRKASITYSEDVWARGHHADDPKKKQAYPIVKDRRYARDTYLLHVPITCNFGAGTVTKFNDRVNAFLKNNPDVNIIGIDRGERHLAYYTVINQRGEILRDKGGNYLQGSFNNPFGDKDYHGLLGKREKANLKARRSWGTIEKIKDLKAGYLSQVTHKIARLMVEHNAIVVFEDLNFGFKRGRMKIEKQVYQKLEKALIDKLNYLVFKDRAADELGGLYGAFQLTDRFRSFQKLGKQTGFVFYVPAYHTSKVCPVTGFVDLLRPRYETVAKAKAFFAKFDAVRFNRQTGYFEFHFNYGKFTSRAEGGRPDWVVCSHGARLENYRDKDRNGQWSTREINISQEIAGLFRDCAIDDLEDGRCLVEQINRQDSADFFRRLMRLLRLTLQMRNSRAGTGEDWLISPVRDDNGGFFDSREANGSMPENADANGAYHIALKGLLALMQLNERGRKSENFKPKLENKAWYAFTQLELPRLRRAT